MRIRASRLGLPLVVALALLATACQPSTAYLSDIDPVQESGCCWYESRPVTINAVYYPNSILYDTGFYNSSLEYNLGRAYGRFRVNVGLTDRSSSTRTINYRVMGDGRQLASGSATLGVNRTLDLDTTGVLRLSLQVVNWSGPEGSAELGWGNARVVR